MATGLPPLDRVDPIEAWQPWQPDVASPWSRKWAAHLYRRAAFGASRQELIQAERAGPQATVELLLHGQSGVQELLPTLNDVGQYAARDISGEQLRGWWLYCMLHGGHPLREKLTLFWHNHFATSVAKVQSFPLMFRQNCLLREHALGKFGPFLEAMSKDGAMLIWLDSNSNVKGRPNENYARELMELFSLGVGHYTEKDIREAARAFTGWRTDGEDFHFEARLHDNGTKTVLGQSGNWNGDDVVRVVLGRSDAARFLVRKLYHFFISEIATPPDSLLKPLCERFRHSDYDIADLVRTMLGSRHFYSAHAFRQRIKSPVEYVMGAVQALCRRYQEGEPEYRPIPQQVLVAPLEAMGQPLFAPPNVKGWPGGRTWLNTSTMLERDNFAQALAMGTLWLKLEAVSPGVQPLASAGAVASPPPKAISKSRLPPDLPEEVAPPRAFDPARLVAEEGVQQPEEVVRVLLDFYLPGGLRPEAQTRLFGFVAQGPSSGPGRDRRIRETVHAILTLPEYHLA
jgi:uncharacterized protein (DUF1800 family)